MNRAMKLIRFVVHCILIRSTLVKMASSSKRAQGAQGYPWWGRLHRQSKSTLSRLRRV
jgi:hypothetical protein